MKTFPIALQLYSVRERMAEDVADTLRAVKAMGYDGVEFAGTFGNTAEELAALCREVGLVPISAHVPFEEMMADPEGVLSYYAALGCRYVVIPYLTEEYRPGHEKFDEVIAGAKQLGELANAKGMTLLYHNHDFEFVKVDGEYALDRLYREVSADYLQTQLDTCWVRVAGEDPAAYIRKYSGRAPVVHLKDFVGQKTENMYALIGIDEDEKKAPQAFEFRPVGSGVQDLPAILAAAEQAGAEWVVVEQDQPDGEHSSLECARLSINYLRAL
ncbi:MAG: sugar phosphate isomerase/epimerase [Clostridia bacterium]|nr:sugar phosphate isomerase/epimerase [Clostridia bacterium]